MKKRPLVTSLTLLFLFAFAAYLSIPHYQGNVPSLPVTDTPSSASDQADEELTYDPTAEPDAQFSATMQVFVDNLSEGQPLTLTLGDETRDYAFRPMRVTTENFKFSTGPNTEYHSAYEVFQGREMTDRGLGKSAAIAIVNDSLAMSVSTENGDYLVTIDGDGVTHAKQLRDVTSRQATHHHDHDHGHSHGHTHDHNHSHAHQGHQRSCTMDNRCQEAITETTSQHVHYGEDIYADLSLAATVDPNQRKQSSPASVDHPYLRLGPKYDRSLKDIIVLAAADKTQSGTTAQTSAYAAMYLSYAARSADIFERQLGLRYLLQELILTPSDSSEPDPNAWQPTDIDASLGRWETWLATYRPQELYNWGHATLWTIVDGAPDGTIGRAWEDGYGTHDSGLSVQEPSYDWDVHNHELGHNLGSAHTVGGLMNAAFLDGQENFYTNEVGQSYSAAKGVYNYLTDANTLELYGEADLRHPEEIPFGADDYQSTPLNTLLSYNPLSNDETSVINGAVNTLSLVEVGMVFPKNAGTAEVVGNTIEFTPSNGFSGRLWFTYTLGGNVGNGGEGWLHSADVFVEVNSTPINPGSPSGVTAEADSLDSDFLSVMRVNPLLNDDGAWRLWSGDVEVVLGPSDTTPESSSDDALYLKNASLNTGYGTLEIEKRPMGRSAEGSEDNSGYIRYTPAPRDPQVVIIDYTVENAFGATDTETITLTRDEPWVTLYHKSQSKISETTYSQAIITFVRDGFAGIGSAETINFIVEDIDGVASGADISISGADSYNSGTGAGVITLPANETSADIIVTAVDDSTTEGSGVEYIFVRITSTTSLNIGYHDSATLAVFDGDMTAYDPLVVDFDDGNLPTNWTTPSSSSTRTVGWSLSTGSTPTASTGPDEDYTDPGTGYFMFIEANDGSFNSQLNAEIVTPLIDLTSTTGGQLCFKYHMYGANSGTLSIDIIDDQTRHEGVWSISGEQSADGTFAEWQSDCVALIARPIYISFNAETGGGTASDMAFDDISLSITFDDFDSDGIADVVDNDDDGDNLSDYYEYLNGTDPLDDDSDDNGTKDGVETTTLTLDSDYKGIQLNRQ